MQVLYNPILSLQITDPDMTKWNHAANHRSTGESRIDSGEKTLLAWTSTFITSIYYFFAI